ncbi:myb-like protein X [Passer domesticus]|uniref:myb-like protein X n=1 Tax=Passer domesticus TaxID=48849 RepID=UPI0030FEC40E
MTDGRASFSAPKVGLGRRPQPSNTRSPGCCQPGIEEITSFSAPGPLCSLGVTVSCPRALWFGEMSTILKWFGREDKEKEEDKKEKEEKEKEKTEGEKEKEKQKRRKKEEEKQGEGEEDRSSSSSDSDSEEDQGIAKDEEKEDKD